MKQLKNKNMKTIATLNLTLVNAETVINSNASEYNAYEWKKNVQRYQQYETVLFYKVENETRYGRDEFVVEYTINGIRGVQHLSYGACLHNGGFYRVMRQLCDANFTPMFDHLTEYGNFDNYKFEENKFIMEIMEFGNGDKTGPADNNAKNRKLFAENNITVTRETFIFLK